MVPSKPAELLGVFIDDTAGGPVVADLEVLNYEVPLVMSPVIQATGVGIETRGSLDAVKEIGTGWYVGQVKPKTALRFLSQFYELIYAWSVGVLLLA